MAMVPQRYMTDRQTILA